MSYTHIQEDALLPQVKNGLETLERIRANREKLDMLEFKTLRDLRLYRTPWRYIAPAMGVAMETTAKKRLETHEAKWGGLEYKDGTFQATGTYDPARDRIEIEEA